ncbi:MAG: hypothetical protein IKH26_12690 [Bacteroidaceae bacterium]|nr:hypothetical protein [Bacteroidaceae bacterium]
MRERQGKVKKNSPEKQGTSKFYEVFFLIFNIHDVDTKKKKEMVKNACAPHFEKNVSFA